MLSIFLCSFQDEKLKLVWFQWGIMSDRTVFLRAFLTSGIFCCYTLFVLFQKLSFIFPHWICCVLCSVLISVHTLLVSAQQSLCAIRSQLLPLLPSVLFPKEIKQSRESARETAGPSPYDVRFLGRRERCRREGGLALASPPLLAASFCIHSRVVSLFGRLWNIWGDHQQLCRHLSIPRRTVFAHETSASTLCFKVYEHTVQNHMHHRTFLVYFLFEIWGTRCSRGLFSIRLIEREASVQEITIHAPNAVSKEEEEVPTVSSLGNRFWNVLLFSTITTLKTRSS